MSSSHNLLASDDPLFTFQFLFLVMDEFVRNKLTEWGFSDWIDRLKEECIDEESFYCLKDEHIDKLFLKVGPNAKFKKKLKLLKSQQAHGETADSALVCPSTSDTRDKGKRKLDHQGESFTSPTHKRRRDSKQRSDSEKKEENILSVVEKIMRRVDVKIPAKDNKLNKFLKKKLNLKTEKRELVGVFGKTGAGKSSLINAVIGEKNVLPSGSISACTSVMIKVEANMQSKKYEAHIEFITKEEWKDELWSLKNFRRDNADQEKDDEQDYQDTVEKLSALYGEEEWKNKTTEVLMDGKNFKEIPEFLQSQTKSLTFKSAEDLSKECVKYLRSASEGREGGEIKRCYWPLVKCVTIKVPDNDLLQHVTLVDLPGNGDYNKSRDQMWKEVVGGCSTVWIVTEINRAASEKEAWEILESASSIIGNGGECQQIHFICTKSDIIGGSKNRSAGACDQILERNKQAKEEVRKEFNKQNKLRKLFKNESLQVFTVSSTEFLEKTYLNSEQTEIPELQKFLQNLNDSHSKTKTSNYVSGAYGILSLIQGASCTEGAGEKTDVCRDLEENIRCELEKVRKPMDKAYETFEKYLSDGVENAKRSCEQDVNSVLFHRKHSGRGFHRILKCLVMNNGTHKPKKGKQINLNMKLASFLTDSIDEEFQRTFPNDGKRGPFNKAISKFSLHTETLIEKYKRVELQLTFLKTEEEKMKAKLSKTIRERKKTVYRSLTTKIEEIMQESYEKAKGFKGKGSMDEMKETIVKHVYDSKNIMFEQAKNEMLSQLRGLKEEILRTLEGTMQKSVELSLKSDGVLIPDVTVELAEVKHYYNDLEDTLMKRVALTLGPSAALSP